MISHVYDDVHCQSCALEHHCCGCCQHPACVSSNYSRWIPINRTCENCSNEHDMGFGFKCKSIEPTAVQYKYCDKWRPIQEVK